jgi:hypothetical protein
MNDPKNPIVYNNRGDYVKPFKMITVIGSRTICRFCEQEFRKNNVDHYSKEYRRRLQEFSRIPVGDRAIEMIVFGGPAGTGYICLPHAYGLQNNLNQTLDDF